VYHKKIVRQVGYLPELYEDARSENIKKPVYYGLVLLIWILFWALQLTDKHSQSDIFQKMDSVLSHNTFLIQIRSLFCLKTAVAFKCFHQES